MTTEEAKQRIQRMYEQGLITKNERDNRINNPDILEETNKEIEWEKQTKENIERELAEITARNTMLISKKIGLIKVGDLVKLDPLFLKSDVVGLVTEIRETKRMFFLYVEWAGEKPKHPEINDRLGTKEFYFIKV